MTKRLQIRLKNFELYPLTTPANVLACASGLALIESRSTKETMSNEKHLQLGRRERQIMDVIYRRGRASVTEVLAELTDPPSYSAVRGMLGLLEDKGYLRHEQEGLKYVYLPADDTRQVRANALKHMVKTFFGGSPEQAVAALLEMSDSTLSSKDKQYLSQLIKKAQQEGR